MKFTTVAVLLAVCLSAFAGANAQNTTSGSNSTSSNVLPYTTLAELYAGVEFAAKNLTIFKAAAEVGLGKEFLTTPFEAGTAFVPTDAAFTATLAAINMTLAELAEMPTLVAALLGYHVTPKVYATVASLKAVKTIDTAIPTLSLGVMSTTPAEASSAGVTLKAAQSEADIIAGPLVMSKGKAVLYVIDMVLLPPAEALAALMPAANSTNTTAPRNTTTPARNTTSPVPAPPAKTNTSTSTNTSTTTARSSAASATFSLAAVAGVVLAALL